MKVSATLAMALMMMAGATFAQQAEIVNTTSGPIQGLRKAVMYEQVDVYYGIPFAKPPVGELRFKRPEPIEPWTEVKSTVTKPNACFQVIDTAFDRFPGVEMWNPNTPMSEDCLYLNVWVPRGSQSPRTTMVWIYGGGFYSGSSALDVYDATRLSARQNVIVMSMNYRVGPLGFLYTGYIDAPVNQGLLDQSLALKWIYDNVVNFGGQQDSITIFGESAGSVSVGLHLLSDLSMNLFSRAIMQSGTPILNDFVMAHSTATERARQLAQVLSCPTTKPSQMMSCLRNVSAQSITDAQWHLPNGMFMDLPTSPVVDDYFLKEDPHKLLAKGAVKDTEILLGANKDEGTFFLLYFYPDLFPFNNSGSISDEEFKTLVHGLNMNGEEAQDRAVMYQYVDRMLPAHRPSFRDIADDISGDRKFVCPTVDFAQAWKKLGGRRAVYLYSFQQRLSTNPWPQWTGVMHGYEIEAVLDLPLDLNYTQQDLQLAARVTGYWTRFAETGNPNTDNAVVWPELTLEEAQYLKITAEGDTVEQGLRHDQCSFRSIILPLLKQDTTTEEPTPCFSDGQKVNMASTLLLGLLCIACGLLLYQSF